MYVEWGIDELPSQSIAVLDLKDCLSAGAKGVDISNEDYHRLGGISGSNLTLLAESNKHLDNKE